jgi:CHAD domain-containing protein
MTDLTKAEVIGALEQAADEVQTRANYLDDPNVITTNHGTKVDQVHRLDRRAQALRYAREILDERWGQW